MSKTRFIGIALLALLTTQAQAEEGVDYALGSEVATYLAEAAAAEAAPPADPNAFRVYWKEGLFFESGDGKFKVKIGGRLYIDQWWRSSNDAWISQGGENEDLTFIRSGRLEVSGTIHETTVFKASYDFANSDIVSLKDLYIGLAKTAVGTILFGNQKVPVSLEDMTSSRFHEFMERSAPGQAFTPGRRVGVEVYWNGIKRGDTPRLTFRIGIFRQSGNDNASAVGDSGGLFGTRLTWLAIDNEVGLGVQKLHVGISFWYQEPDDDGTLRFRSRPDAGDGDRALDTGEIPADNSNVIGFEIAHVVGSFSWQAEAFLAEMDDDAGTDPSFSGWYVQISYWITGEQRNYQASRGIFNRVRPNQDFSTTGDGRGWGAWEIAFRYDRLDLNDQGIQGGDWTGFVIAINWHWNPNTRVMFDYVIGENEESGIEGEVDAFGMRFQVDF